MISQETEVEILERISRSQSTIHQRDLARIVGLSLGMTNAILKRLARKGLLQIKKVNNRNIQYIVSPRGMEAIARRSYQYFKRTIRNVVSYKEAMDGLVQEIKRKGFSRLLLVGTSDLDFVVEHSCSKYGIDYCDVADVSEDSTAEDGSYMLYSENMDPPTAESESSASLRSLFVDAVNGKLERPPT